MCRYLLDKMFYRSVKSYFLWYSSALASFAVLVCTTCLKKSGRWCYFLPHLYQNQTFYAFSVYLWNWMPNIWWIRVCSSYIFLMNCSLCWCVVTSFSFLTCFCLKFALSDRRIDSSSSLILVFVYSMVDVHPLILSL